MSRAVHRFTTGAGPRQAHLRLLSLSDLHMQIVPHDYAADRPVQGRSLALAASEARLAAAEAANTLLFDVGDACEGSPIDAELAAERSGPHPMSAALAAAGVDAATLGNHDFDQGLPAVERLLRESPVPLTLCNLVRRRGACPAQDETLAPPFVMLDRAAVCGDGAARSLRIGVIGTAPPQTLSWNADTLEGRLVARDAVEAVAARLPQMRAAGADLVVVLAHAGIGGAAAQPGMEHAAVPLAALPGVDVVLAGHAHGLFPDPAFVPQSEVVDPRAGRLHGKPAVMPGCLGQAVGVVDLLLETDGGGWRVAGSAAALRPVRAERPDPAVCAAARPHHGRTLSEIRRPVARAARPLHTYFALITDSPAVRLVKAAQLEAVRAARPDIAAAEGEVPLLSAAAPLRSGGLQGADAYTDVPAGPLLRRHLMDLQVYPNRLRVVPVTGAELRLWLERAASVFATVPRGARDAVLLDPRHAAYAFDSIAGVTYRIDVSAPPLPAAWDRQAEAGHDPGKAGRIRDLACGGRPVAAHDRFWIATSSYRLGSHPAYAALRARSQPVGGTSVRDVLETHVRAGGAERPPLARAWTLAPVPGATALYPTGPGARAGALPERPGAGVLSRVGAASGGFDLYRVDLDRAHLLDPDATGSDAGGPGAAEDGGSDPGIA